jgi:hypothetical protein
MTHDDKIHFYIFDVSFFIGYLILSISMDNYYDLMSTFVYRLASTTSFILCSFIFRQRCDYLMLMLVYILKIEKNEFILYVLMLANVLGALLSRPSMIFVNVDVFLDGLNT